MNILLVDDNIEITEMLAKYLELENFDVTVANGGKNGLAEIRKGNFDRILLDLAMPEVTGVDVMDELKKDKVDFNNIIIFTASSIKDAEINHLLASGIKSCIKKPINMPDLVKIIKS